MKYELNLLSRVIFAFIPIKFFEVIFLPLTIYPVYFILSFIINPVLSKNVILIGENSLLFDPACIAGAAYYLLLLLIIFTKDIDFKKRLYLFGLGSIAILIMNIIRIIVLALVLFYLNKDIFNMIHIFFWYIISGVYVAFVWILLVKYFNIKSIPIYDDIIYLYKRIRK